MRGDNGVFSQSSVGFVFRPSPHAKWRGKGEQVNVGGGSVALQASGAIGRSWKALLLGRLGALPLRFCLSGDGGRLLKICPLSIDIGFSGFFCRGSSRRR